MDLQSFEFLFISILLIHFLADFGLQTHEQATGKSTYFLPLVYHVGVYTLVWLLFIYAITSNVEITLKFATITFIAHYCTDFITSRIGKKFWDKNDALNGFVVVGFDQILHYLQLFYTFKLLIL